MRESGIQAAEAIVAGGAAAAARSVSENQTMLALRGGGDWLDRTLRIPRRPPKLAPPPDEVPALPLQQWRSPPMLPLPRAAAKRSSRCPAPPRAPPPPPAAPPSAAGAPLPRAGR